MDFGSYMLMTLMILSGKCLQQKQQQKQLYFQHTQHVTPVDIRKLFGGTY